MQDSLIPVDPHYIKLAIKVGKAALPKAREKKRNQLIEAAQTEKAEVGFFFKKEVQLTREEAEEIADNKNLEYSEIFDEIEEFLNNLSAALKISRPGHPFYLTLKEAKIIEGIVNE